MRRSARWVRDEGAGSIERAFVTRRDVRSALATLAKRQVKPELPPSRRTQDRVVRASYRNLPTVGASSLCIFTLGAVAVLDQRPDMRVCIALEVAHHRNG
jgi:hypothetical protein